MERSLGAAHHACDGWYSVSAVTHWRPLNPLNCKHKIVRGAYISFRRQNSQRKGHQSRKYPASRPVWTLARSNSSLCTINGPRNDLCLPDKNRSTFPGTVARPLTPAFPPTRESKVFVANCCNFVIVAAVIVVFYYSSFRYYSWWYCLGFQYCSP